MYSPSFQNTSVEVDTAIQFFDAKNGQGNQVGGSTNKTIYFLDGYVEQRDAGNSQYDNQKLAQTNRLIQVPENVQIQLPRFSNNGLQYQTITSNQTGWLNLTGGSRVYIERLCNDTRMGKSTSKYMTDYRQIVFINKQGAYQSLWFKVIRNKTTDATGSSFQSLATDHLGRVDRFEHYYKQFDRNSKQKMSLMSPLVPEGFNDVFQELLVSEKVWLWDWNYLWEFITNPLVKPMPQPTGTVRFVDPYTGIVTGKRR